MFVACPSSPPKNVHHQKLAPVRCLKNLSCFPIALSSQQRRKRFAHLVDMGIDTVFWVEEMKSFLFWALWRVFGLKRQGAHSRGSDQSTQRPRSGLNLCGSGHWPADSCMALPAGPRRSREVPCQEGSHLGGGGRGQRSQIPRRCVLEARNG